MSGELPEGWAEAKLHKCVDVLDSLRIPVNSEERANRQGNIPYYGATGQVGWIDDFIFDEELVLIGEDGAPFFDKAKPISYIIQGKSWVNNHAHVLRAITGITTNQYLKNYFDWFDFHDYVNGTTRLKLTQGSMNKIPVRLAPINEQHRIVTKLEHLLEKVESSRTRLEKIPTLLKRFRQSVLAGACSGHLTEEWRNKREESRQDWASVGFFDFCILQRGYDLPLSQAIEGPYPIVTSAGVVAYHDKFKARRPGVVTGRSGSIGSVFFIQEDYWPHNTVLYVRDFKGNDPKFVYFFLLGFNINQYSASTAVPTLNRNNLREISIEVPPLPEQHEIVRRVEELFALAERIEARYQKAKAQVDKLAQSILAKAFRGELVPQDPNDLPAPWPGVWFVYVLECEDGSYYKGITKDILERWKQHARGTGAEWTAKHPPQKLVHWEEFSSESAAAEREKELKTGFGRKWLEREIRAGRTRQAGEPASVLLARIQAKRESIKIETPRPFKKRKKKI